MLTLVAKLGMQIEERKQLNHKERLLCSSCGRDVGTIDPLTNGWKLEKQSLSINLSTNCDHEEPVKLEQTIKTSDRYPTASAELARRQKVQKWISAQLLALAENENTRTFLVRSIVQGNAAANENYESEQTKPSSVEATSRPLLVS